MVKRRSIGFFMMLCILVSSLHVVVWRSNFDRSICNEMKFHLFISEVQHSFSKNIEMMYTYKNTYQLHPVIVERRREEAGDGEEQEEEYGAVPVAPIQTYDDAHSEHFPFPFPLMDACIARF